MNTRKPALLCLAIGATLLAACSAGNTPASSASAAASGSSTSSLIASVVDHALDRADARLRTGNITISGNDGIVIMSDDNSNGHAASGLPKAQITPQGDLLISDKPVAVTPAQRQMLLAYRQQLIDIGTQGIAIGKEGAALGVRATSAALAAVFAGKSEQQVHQQVEAQTTGIRAAAAKLCDRLPALMASQQQLAADLPAFKPYAQLTPQKIDQCRKDALHDNDTSRADTRQSVRDRIRGGIRSGVQAAAQGTGLASRNTPDASPATSTASAQ